jgi:hypothetical protein
VIYGKIRLLEKSWNCVMKDEYRKAVSAKGQLDGKAGYSGYRNDSNRGKRKGVDLHKVS